MLYKVSNPKKLQEYLFQINGKHSSWEKRLNFKFNKEIYTYDNSKKYLKNKKIFICAGCELQHLQVYLSKICNTYSTFNNTSMDIYSELNNPNTIIKQFNADYYILSIVQLIKTLIYKYEDNTRQGYINKTSDVVREYFNSIFINLKKSLHEIRKFSNKPIFLISMISIFNEPYSGINEYLNKNNDICLYELIKKTDLEFYNLSRKFEMVYILNLESIIEDYNKKICIEPYQLNQYGHLTPFGSALLAEYFYNQLMLMDSSLSRIKCVVIDLDNTLWDGIMIEDGIENVLINEEICSILLSLLCRGIIITICSKNDEQNKEKIMNKIYGTNWGSCLKNKFACIKINFKPKSINIKAIAQELNIGLESIAFFDDSDYERREVKTNIPQLNVYTDKDIYYCLNNPRFNNYLGITSKNNKLRIKNYLNNLKNVVIEEEYESFNDFMINSQFKINFELVKTEDSLYRVIELINKTNQMNITLNRSNKENIKKYYLDVNNYWIFKVNLKDKHMDYGFICTIIVEKISHNELNIIEFAMSCRAMGKKVENYIIISILNYFKENFYSIEITPKSNGKNSSLITVLKNYKFQIHYKGNPQIEFLRHYFNKDDKFNLPCWFK